MNQPPAFQFYVDNFIQGTCDMEPSEVGIYIRLLCYQWSNGYIPSEKGRLSRVAGGEVSEHVLTKFVKGPDGMLRNARMERERAKQIHFRQKQAEFGKTGGRPRKATLLEAFDVEKGFVKGSQSPPSPSPSPLKERKRSFEKPTIEAVRLLATKAGLPESEADKFFYHYDSKGWKVGKEPMQSLPSAIGGWAVRWRQNGSTQSHQPASGGFD